MASQPAASHQLNYGTQPPAYRRWLRVFWVVALGALFSVGGWLAKGSIDRWFTKWKYNREMAKWYAAAAERVEQPPLLKYTDDVTRDGASFDLKFPFVRPKLLHQDPFIDRMPIPDASGSPALRSGPCILFARERTNAVGAKRLLIVTMCFWWHNTILIGTEEVGINTTGPLTGMIGTIGRSAAYVDMSGFATLGTLRLFSGQADTADAAKFGIPFESNGRRGHLCGTFDSKNEVAWKVVEDRPTTQMSN